MELLEHRVSVLDKLFYGSLEKDSVNINEIDDRLEQVNLKLSEVEARVSNVKTCRDLLQQLKIQNMTIVTTKQQVLDMMTKRNEILTMIRELHEIKKLEKYASMPISQDIPQLDERLRKLEKKVESQSGIIQNQSRKLDSLLDIYHEMVNMLSEKCVEIDMKLTNIENDK